MPAHNRHMWNCHGLTLAGLMMAALALSASPTFAQGGATVSSSIKPTPTPSLPKNTPAAAAATGVSAVPKPPTVSAQTIASIREAWQDHSKPLPATITAQDVLAAVDDPRLWLDAADVPRKLTISAATLVDRAAPTDRTHTVYLHVPPDYSTQTRWPLVVVMHGTGQSADAALAWYKHMLGPASQTHVIASVQAPVAGVSQASDGELAQPAEVVAGVSAWVRIDPDRVHVSGYSRGGHTAFVAPALHRDRFASAMPLAGTFFVRPFFENQARVLLPNLSDTLVVAVYGANDGPGAGGSGNSAGGSGSGASGPIPAVGPAGEVRQIAGINATNQFVANLLVELDRQTKGLSDRVQLYELPGVGHVGVQPELKLVQQWLDARRHPIPVDGSNRVHRFRSASEGHVSMVQARKLDGPLFDPTESPQVRVGAGQSPEAAVRAWFAQRMGRLQVGIKALNTGPSKSITDNPASPSTAKPGAPTLATGKPMASTIDIRHDKVSDMDVWISPALMDIRQPVSITVNGRVRYSEVVIADATVALDWLKATGDTQRVAVARVQITPAGASLARPPMPGAATGATPKVSKTPPATGIKPTPVRPVATPAVRTR